MLHVLTRNAGINFARSKKKTSSRRTFCLNVRATDKYRIQEKGKRTKATKRHILDDDADLRSHMPCEGKVLTFNIGGLKHFSGKRSSTGRDAQRKTLARRCTFREKPEPNKAARISSGEETLFLGRPDGRHAAQATAGHPPPATLPTGGA